VNVRLRVLGLVGILLGLLLVSGANAALHRQVRFTLVITGHGGVRLSNGRQFGCGSTSCRRKLLVRAGSRITLKAMPARLWAFSSWAGACKGTKPTCTVRLRRSATVTEKLLPPGSTSANPIPLGHAAAIGHSWMFTVNSATPDATAQILAIPGNTPPPPGAQYFMLNVAVTYTGGGSSSLGRFDGLETIGAHNATYTLSGSGCFYEDLPPPDLQHDIAYEQIMYSGQSATGNICFRIASNDADSLQLKVYVEDQSVGSEYIWFALR
jgi:hypothetical protein